MRPSLNASSLIARLDVTLAMVAVVLGLATSDYSAFFFDGRVPQGYPFEEPVRQLIDLLGHGFTWIPPV